MQKKRDIINEHYNIDVTMSTREQCVADVTMSTREQCVVDVTVCCWCKHVHSCVVDVTMLLVNSVLLM